MDKVFELATMLGGIALVALLVSNADNASKLINSGARAYGGLLGVVTLQSQYQNLFSN
jgi:hypothetical protein